MICWCLLVYILHEPSSWRSLDVLFADEAPRIWRHLLYSRQCWSTCFTMKTWYHVTKSLCLLTLCDCSSHLISGQKLISSKTDFATTLNMIPSWHVYLQMWKVQYVWKYNDVFQQEHEWSIYQECNVFTECLTEQYKLFTSSTLVYLTCKIHAVC